jgi:UDP:flavonoid glycosyltransferase YjiC (YdhE family)
MSRRIRVLFVAEDVTLAQVVRLAQLARGLSPLDYEVHFACAHFDPMIFAGAQLTKHVIYSVDRRSVLRAAERGQRLYGESVLARYVDDELSLFRQLRPDVVLGDLRVSLCVSAPHAGIPYAALINAYWSRRDAFPVPDHPVMSLLGERLVSRYFPRALPWVLAYFAEPVNRLRRRYGLAPIGDFIDVLTYGDMVFFPDVPWLTPVEDAPPHHVFLGPVLWSPDVPMPAMSPHGWSEERPIYLTLGSSGRVARLPRVLAGLAPLGRPILVATADRTRSTSAAPNVLAAPFLPGDEASRVAALVVCNGGSSTAYQALAAGCPVLGIASNFDQFLAMDAIAARGAGSMLRARSVTPAKVEAVARELLAQPSYTASAARARDELARYDAHTRFEAHIRQLAADRPLVPLARDRGFAEGGF